MKTCTKCGSQFERVGTSKSTYCNPCTAAYQREWRKKNPAVNAEYKRRYRERHPEKIREEKRKQYHRDIERSRAQQRQWRIDNPDKAAARVRAQKDRVVNGVGYSYYRHGITTAERDAILASQGGKCAICRKDMATARVIAVDHDHACCPEKGRRSCGNCIRGVICNPCNFRLGWFEKYQDRIAQHLTTRHKAASPPTGRPKRSTTS